MYFKVVPPNLAELVGVAGHFLEGLVVLLLPAVEVDALLPHDTVVVIRASHVVARIIRERF